MGNADSAVVKWKEFHWKVVPSEYILGLTDIHTTSGNAVIYDVEVTLADHLVEMHNNWWDIQIWGSYMSNIAASFDRLKSVD